MIYKSDVFGGNRNSHSNNYEMSLFIPIHFLILHTKFVISENHKASSLIVALPHGLTEFIKKEKNTLMNNSFILCNSL